MGILDVLKSQWDRVLAALLTAAGIVALLLGYLGMRDVVFPGQQIPYVISGGLFGLMLVGIGGVLWMSADLRDEWRKLDALDRKLDALTGHHATTAEVAGAADAPVVASIPAERDNAVSGTPS